MGTLGNSDCQRASRSALNDFTEDALTISAGNLFQNGTARMVKANWRRCAASAITVAKLQLPSTSAMGQLRTIWTKTSCLATAITKLVSKFIFQNSEH